MATERQGMSITEFEQAIFDLDGATESQNWLVYGDSGCGKTALAGTLPGRLFFLAGEPGYISAARLGTQGRGRLVPDTATANAAADWLEDGAARKIDWLVVDGLSTMNVKFLLSYAAEAFDANPAKRVHRNLPDKPDYYNTQNFTKGWVARLIDLPCNVLFTAHAMRPEGEDGETLVYPAIQGKGYEVSNYVCGLMHVVAYMAIAKVGVKGRAEPRQVRRLLFQSYIDPENGTRYFAKDQYTALGRWATVREPDVPDGATMEDLVAKCDTSYEPVKAAKPSKGKRA